LDGMAQDVVCVDRVEELFDEVVELGIELDEEDDEDGAGGASQGSQDSRLLAT